MARGKIYFGQVTEDAIVEFNNQLPIIFLGFLFDNSIVGLFGLAIGMVSLPINLVGQSVGDVFYGKISSLGIDKAYEIRLLAKSTLVKITLIAIIPAMVLIFFGEDLFSFAFGLNAQSFTKDDIIVQVENILK